MKRLLLALCVYVALFAPLRAGAAEERWFEIKSPNFTVWSNAADGNARTLVWQLEQIRSAMSALWPWAKVEMSKPMLVLAVKDEQSMKNLAPKYWETRGSVQPVSVWVSGADQHYLAIRADVRGEDNATLNPHTSAYFSYVNLVLDASFERDLPLWFSRGLAGVLSNTLVRENHIALGAPIPWHLEMLRERARIPLARLVSVDRSSPEYLKGDALSILDAQSWAFVHYLMFGEGGVHRERVNRLATLLAAGKPGDAAVTEALGPVEAYERGFGNYLQRNVFSYQKAIVDSNVKRERFAARPMPPAEAAAGRAVFHVAMQRPTEAQALIAEARRTNPNEPGAYLAEALQADRADRREEAKAAFVKATELGSSNAYAAYRAATLHWPRPDAAQLEQMEKALVRSIELNPSFAPAYADLAEVRTWLKKPPVEVMPLLAKAVTLEPRSPRHRLTAARVLWRLGSPDEARKAAQVALTLADTDAERAQAEQLLTSFNR